MKTIDRESVRLSRLLQWCWTLFEYVAPAILALVVFLVWAAG